MSPPYEIAVLGWSPAPRLKPGPSADHAEPFQRATPFTIVGPIDWKSPTATRSVPCSAMAKTLPPIVPPSLVQDPAPNRLTCVFPPATSAPPYVPREYATPERAGSA